MTLIAVLAGIAVVLIGILAFRMHAVLALLAGAVATALLTDGDVRRDDIVSKSGIPATGFVFDQSTSRWTLSYPAAQHQEAWYDVVLNGEAGKLTWIGTFIPDHSLDTDSTGAGRVMFATADFANTARQDNSQCWLLPAGKLGEIKAALKRSLGERLAFGFGRTAGKIGLIIALAAVIGQALLHSGAADRIVRTTFSFTGEKAAPAAFVVSGFVLGIPVFFDTVFYLMIPLGKALYARTRRNYLTYVLTIICGGTMAHSLVPPTPGPLLVAAELGVPIATMIGYGCLVGLVTATIGYFYALIIGSRCELIPTDVPESDADDDAERPAPSFGLSLAPILMPVFFITVSSLLKANDFEPFPGMSLLLALGDKNIALMLAAALALLMLVRWNQSEKPVSELISEALTSGAMIVLITGAGGAFGSVLQESGLRSLISGLPPMSVPMLLTIAFLITCAIRTAQGSATVAMITSVALFADLATSNALPCAPVYLALAIGCGSKPLAWMADSGFWVITRMSGMTPEQGLKYITPMTGFMGVAGLGATIALAMMAPGI